MPDHVLTRERYWLTNRVPPMLSIIIKTHIESQRRKTADHKCDGSIKEISAILQP